MLALLNEPILSIFLATVSPTIALIAVNTGLFSRRQMKHGLLVITLIGALLAGGFHAANTLWLQPLLTGVIETPELAGRLLGCLLSLGLFFALSQRLFSELIADRKTRLLTQLGVTVLFMAATAFISMTVLTGVLALYTAVSLFDVRKNLKAAHQEPATPPAEVREKSEQKIKFRHTPNVYVLFLESVHSSGALSEIYDIDSSDLRDYLHDNDFTLYDDYFSNSYMTELAFSNLMWPEKLYDPLHFREFSPVPPSRIASAFIRNGYELNLFSSDYLKSRFAELFHFTGNGITDAGSRLGRHLAPIFSQSATLRRWFNVPDVFENETDFNGLLNELRLRIEDTADTPQLHWFHFGAEHSPQSPWSELEPFEQAYRNYYKRAKGQLRQTVDMINNHDPDPLIIAVGDHGACRFRYISDGVGDNPNDIIREHGREPSLVAKDYFSVFLGIRWPVQHYIDGQAMTHVRLFDHVIAALSEDATHLEHMMPNLSIFNSAQLRGPHVVARDGAPLTDWEPLSAENELELLVTELDRNPEDVTSHLALANKYLGNGQMEQGLEYLKSLAIRFPQSEEVRLTLANVAVNLKNHRAARQHALAAIDINPNCGMAYYWLAMVAESEGNAVQCDNFITKAFECGGTQSVKKDLHLRYAYILIKQGKYAEANAIFDEVNWHDRVAFTETIDWQMQYAAFVRGDNPRIFEWLDELLVNPDGRHIIVRVNDRKLILAILTGDWPLAEQIARKCLELNENHLAAWVALGRSLEMQGNLAEGLQTYAQGVSKTQNQLLLDQLGYMALRHNVDHPELNAIKEAAREKSAAQAGPWARQVGLDPQWYAQAYGAMLGGQDPAEHYFQNAIALMLCPNAGFDTAYYFSNHTDVFTGGVDAALHYVQYGQHELFRPRMSCLFDHSITPNPDWRQAAA